MNYKDTKPYMSVFFLNWPVNGICGIVFTRFYRLEIHSLMVGIFDPTCELFPHGRRNYSWVLLPLYLLDDPPPPSQTKCAVYTDSVWLWWGGGGGVGDVELCCRPCSAGVLHSVSDQIQNLQNCFTTPKKWPVKTTLKVHKIENFFDSDFWICVISLLVLSKY